MKFAVCSKHWASGGFLVNVKAALTVADVLRIRSLPPMGSQSRRQSTRA